MSGGLAGTVVPPAFLHDLNACVGCHACAIACINEHALAPGRFWRHIVTFNPERRPLQPTFHLSLACNHCLDAPCERACPALAISRDPRTGAVLIDRDACIGCRYCSWVCPYDAPTLDASQGVMQKCTLCTHRLREGLQPACVGQCPTGALRLAVYDQGALRDVTGFPQFPARPAIAFVPLTRRPPPPPQVEEVLDVAAFARAEAELGPDVDALLVARHPQKISLRDEWALAAFTFVAIVLTAWQGAAALGGPSVRPLAVLALAAAAMGVSATHLGRPAQAWRAALNWRRSWLSREVIAFPVFVAIALLAAWTSGGSLAGVHEQAGHAPVVPLDTRSAVPMVAAFARAWTVLATAAGVALLVCIDRVYASMATRGLGQDEAAALTSAAFLAGVFSGAPWLVAVGGGLRLAAAAVRPFTSRAWTRGRQARTVFRIAVGLGVPCALWLSGTHLVLAAGCAVVGELLDRADFYDALDVVTPSSVMQDASAAAHPPHAPALR
jgi:Fe-S-cluster-containing dehydrogenase component